MTQEPMHLTHAIAQATVPSVKFRPGETWESRHRRRYRHAWKNRTIFRRTLRDDGYDLNTTTDDQAWEIIKSNLPIALWWPETATLIIGDTATQHHVHNWHKVIHLLRKTFKYANPVHQ